MDSAIVACKFCGDPSTFSRGVSHLEYHVNSDLVYSAREDEAQVAAGLAASRAAIAALEELAAEAAATTAAVSGRRDLSTVEYAAAVNKHPDTT
jgi:hypothetical protein